MTIFLARAAWIRCGQPAGAFRAAADRQCSAITSVRVEGLTGELWVQSRGPVTLAPIPASAPGPRNRAPPPGPVNRKPRTLRPGCNSAYASRQGPDQEHFGDRPTRQQLQPTPPCAT